MPRFFFHIQDGKSIPDHKGVEVPDRDAARLHAITVAGRIVADEPQRLGLGEDWTMEVTDDQDLVLFRVCRRLNGLRRLAFSRFRTRSRDAVGRAVA